MQAKPKPITVSVKIKKPMKVIWHHLTNPASIQVWNQASDDWETTLATVDLKVGGKFLSHMQAKDGSAGFDFEGTYTRVTPFSRYDYVMSDGREVVVTLKPFFNTVTVSYVFDPESENPREMQQEGWQSILNSFKAFVEKQPK